jgi:transposase-like protein
LLNTFHEIIFAVKKIMEEKKQQRRKFSASEISAVLKRYRQSGKNRREFCDLEGISYSSLGNWMRAKKKRRKKFPAKKSGGFVSLDLAGSLAAAPLVQISFPLGHTVSFFTRPDAELVKQLLR